MFTLAEFDTRYAGMQVGTVVTLTAPDGRSTDHTLQECWGGLCWDDGGHGSTPLHMFPDTVRSLMTNWGYSLTIRQGETYGLSVGEAIAEGDARRARQAEADRDAAMRAYGRVPWWA